MTTNSIKSLWSLILGMSCIILSGWVQAVEVKDLYKTSVIVADRSSDSLKQGGREALAEVIVRVSGDSSALESFDINQAMANPSRFMEQYGYLKATQENPETGLPEPVFELKVTFNARSINQLIRRAGLSIWASNRAEVLVWLVMEDESGRRFVNADTAPEVVEELQKQAGRRGLPLAFPMNDLEDQLAVTPGDVWGMFMDRITQGSERYTPGAILAGKVYAPGAEGSLASWTLQMDGEQELLESNGMELAKILTPAIDHAADKLASKYAVTLSGGDVDFIWLNVAGVETLKDFAQLTAYLEKLVAIRQANMGQLEEDKTRFRVYLESDIENLQQLLALDKKLIEIKTEVAPLGVTLAAINQETVVEGNAVELITDQEVEGQQPSPILEQISSIPELSYHWHRTYVTPEL